MFYRSLLMNFSMFLCQRWRTLTLPLWVFTNMVLALRVCQLFFTTCDLLYRFSWLTAWRQCWRKSIRTSLVCRRRQEQKVKVSCNSGKTGTCQNKLSVCRSPQEQKVEVSGNSGKTCTCQNKLSNCWRGRKMERVLTRQHHIHLSLTIRTKLCKPSLNVIKTLFFGHFTRNPALSLSSSSAQKEHSPT